MKFVPKLLQYGHMAGTWGDQACCEIGGEERQNREMESLLEFITASAETLKKRTSIHNRLTRTKRCTCEHTIAYKHTHLNSLWLANWKETSNTQNHPLASSFRLWVLLWLKKQGGRCWIATTRYTGRWSCVIWLLQKKAAMPSRAPGVFRGSPCVTIGSERNSEVQRRTAEFRETHYKVWKHAKEPRLNGRVLLWACAWRKSERKSNAHMLARSSAAQSAFFFFNTTTTLIPPTVVRNLTEG